MTLSSCTRSARLVATALIAATVVALSSLTGCAASAAPESDEPTEAAGTPYGDSVDGGGAAEAAEPARALIVADESGELMLLDLATEERTIIADGGDPLAALDGTGRFLFLTREHGGESTVDVVDSGRWTQPHGDHSHYFAGSPRLLGTIEGAGRATVGIGVDATVIVFDGEVVTLVHEELGELGELGSEEISAADAATRAAAEATGPALSLAGELVVAAGGGVTVPGLPPVTCSDPADADITRVGAVFACADGAALVRREVGGALAAESIPYPAGAAASASALAGRTDRPDLAGVAGGSGAWLLDVRDRVWTHLPSDMPLVRAAAIGDDASRTVVIDVEGAVRVLGPDGDVLARTEPLVAASLAEATDRVQLLVDGDHAYVSDLAAGAVHEIDLDDARVRTLADLQPWALALVG